MPVDEARCHFILEECVREAARLLQGPAVASDRDELPLRFWTLAELLGVDPRDIGDRQYVAEIDGVLRKSEGEGPMATIETLFPAIDAAFTADPTTRTMTLTLNLRIVQLHDGEDQFVSLSVKLSAEDVDRVVDELGTGLLPRGWSEDWWARARQEREAKTLTAAVKKAVEVGLLPPAEWTLEKIDDNWRKVKAVLEAALAAADEAGEIGRLTAKLEIALRVNREIVHASNPQVVPCVDHPVLDVIALILNPEFAHKLSAVVALILGPESRLGRPDDVVPAEDVTRESECIEFLDTTNGQRFEIVVRPIDEED